MSDCGLAHAGRAGAFVYGVATANGLDVEMGHGRQSLILIMTLAGRGGRLGAPIRIEAPLFVSGTVNFFCLNFYDSLI